jgi:hypothetical protein
VNSPDATPCSGQVNSTGNHRVYRTIEFLKNHLADRFTEDRLALSAGVTESTLLDFSNLRQARHR